MKKNKLIAAGLLVLLPVITAQAATITGSYNCDKPIINAKTADGKKEVLICLSGNFVTYTFGKVGAVEPEIDLLIDTAYTRFEKFKYNQTFEVSNGSYFYRYSYYPKYDFDHGEEKVVGVDKNSLRVFKGDKLIREIPMQEPTEFNISWELQNVGIRNIIK